VLLNNKQQYITLLFKVFPHSLVHSLGDFELSMKLQASYLSILEPLQSFLFFIRF